MPKLTSKQIDAIQRLYNKGMYGVSRLAEIFNVTPGTIYYWIDPERREKVKRRARERRREETSEDGQE